MKEAIKSQYAASLAMLRNAVELCGDGLWLDADYTNPFWRVAYHALFFTHLYASKSHEEFRPWPKHIDELDSLGPMIHKDWQVPKEGLPYSKDNVLEYWDFTMEHVMRETESCDSKAESGFFWLPFNKLELQFYNIRHIHQHTGQLADRLRERQGVGLGWVARGEDVSAPGAG